MAAIADPHRAKGKTINNQFIFSNMATGWPVIFKLHMNKN
ncbi:hypothetical protein EV11_0158 [Prochlorococcus sp. SS52]|nr:hypothetical protein EV11_0158 [Prochlorococcus sp. SS52]